MSTNPRTGLDELDHDQSWELLGRRSVGRLAVSIDNKPDVFPVNYLLDEDTIVVRTAAGLKLAAAVLGAGVAFEVDTLDEESRTGWSVVVRGTAAEVTGLDDLLAAHELPLETWADSDKTRFLRITPEVVTGRAIPD